MKNRILLPSFLTILLTVFLYPALAQDTTGYSIAGRVMDSTAQKGIGFTTISLMSDSNVLLRKQLTNEEGVFSFTGLKKASYSLVFTSVGFAPQTVAVPVAQNSVQTDIGPVYLLPLVKDLGEVKVSASKPLIRQQAGGLTYDLTADPNSKSSNMLDIMRKVPFLSLDAAGNLLFKGNSSFRILINGKPSSMMERNALEVLKSMPASTIQRIEVITTPPAKYDAEGLAGIINIITTKKITSGYSGSLNASYNYPVGGPGMGGSFTFKQGRFGMNAFGGGGFYTNPRTNYAMQRISKEPENTLQQDGNRKSDGRSGYIGTELSFEIDSLNLVTGQVNLNGSQSDGNNYLYSQLREGTTLAERYSLTGNGENHGNGMDASLNFQHGFRHDKSKLLTLSYRYSRYRNEQLNEVDVADQLNFAVPDYYQTNEERPSENTLQLDYVQNFKNLRMEAGIKGIMRNNNSDYSYFSYNSGTGNFEKLPDFSNRFTNDQNVLAAYNSYRYNWKKWEVNAGVRIEQTMIDADFISSASKVSRKFFNVIPTLSLNRGLTDNSSINFGFVQRIKRPSITRLNPFVDRSNPNFEKSGNPNLRPVLLNDLQLGYNVSKKLSLTLGLGYSFFNKLDLRVVVYDPATNITRSTFDNVGKGSRTGLDFNVGYPVTEKWHFSLNGNIAYFIMKGQVGSDFIDNNWFTYFFAPSTSYRFEKNWTVNANLTAISRNPASLQGTSNALVSSSFSVSKELNKFSFTASVNNPFTKYRNNKVITEGPGFLETSSSRDYFRSFGLNINYRFGKLKGGIKKSSRKIVNDDVSKKE